jgi:hypothetical protein
MAEHRSRQRWPSLRGATPEIPTKSSRKVQHTVAKRVYALKWPPWRGPLNLRCQLEARPFRPPDIIK